MTMLSPLSVGIAQNHFRALQGSFQHLEKCQSTQTTSLRFVCAKESPFALQNSTKYIEPFFIALLEFTVVNVLCEYLQKQLE